MLILDIAIVGHTNTGKTSLVRALTNDQSFGEVKNAPSTTIDVTMISLSASTVEFNFYDTPGIEDAMGILEALQNMRSDEVAKREEKSLLKLFLQAPEMQEEFDQEIKILRQVLRSDLVLYVIDIRQPILPKYLDEIALLQKAHIPILPILNFISEEGFLEEWKTELRAYGLHNYLVYDTIILPRKQRLFEQISIMFPEHYDAIQVFIDEQNQKDQLKKQDALKIASQFFINLMTLQVKSPIPIDSEKLSQSLEKKVIKVEKKAVDALLKIYRFSREDVHYIAYPLTNAYAQNEFLSTDEMINFSMQFSKGAVAGAGAFAGIDLMSGLTTLGAATATGAVVGGIANTLRHYSGKLWDKWNNVEVFCLNDNSVLALYIRFLYLIERLNDRSHAAISPLLMQSEAVEVEKFKPLFDKMRYLRTYPELFEMPNHDKAIKASKEIIEFTNSILVR